MKTGLKVSKEELVNSVGFSAKLSAVDRPVTKHGLEGIKTGVGSSQGRKIRDRYYYVNLLKKLNTELQNETDSMTSEIETINKNQAEFQNLKNEFDTVQDEMNKLEGTLADYNLSADKLRSNARVEDIQEILKTVKQKNAARKEESDAIFITKKTKEEELEEFEEELRQLNSQIETKLQDLDPNEKMEFDRIKQENAALLEKHFILKDENQKYQIIIVETEHLLQVAF